MFGLDNLIDAIFSSAAERLSRNERVIKLLKKFNLDPDHPPADFTGVYQYALVEYGVDKPKPVLDIFRQTEIQQLFREALTQNNPALLLQRGEAFLRDHPLGQDIQTNQVDVRREFYEFAAVFIEVTKRTRTPADILTNQKLDSLHQQINSLQERLHRLPTLEGMRTEMARLAAQDYPALPGSEPFNAEKCRAFALAQQMRGWFETLGYDFESYEVWEADYFEWMINYRIGRRRYSRALVRGVDGEVGLADVIALRQSVDAQKADEGWLVTTRRIARAARDEVAKAENEHLGCYTFDEFLDQDADFSGYLTWLEQEIQQRGIDEKYVPLACVKEEIDPATRQRIGVSRYDERDGWIDGYLDLWLDDPAKEHISILGEFGTGKTWFAFHYAWKALQRYRDAQNRGVDRPRLPLVIPLRDYAKAVSVESLFSEFFFRKHEIPIPGYTAFEQLNRMGKLLLIFDGFDEMAARVDRQQMINNFWELAKVVVPGAKVILTCRTEHFPEAKEGRALLNAELQASTKDLTGETPQFEVLELEKFNDEQIRQVLSYQAQPATVEQIMGNPQLLDLARRPVLTELILEALPDIEAGKPVDMSRVYLYAVRHKMERDIKAERTFTSMADKLYFMCELSWEMLSTDRMSINYREFPDRIRQLFGSVVEEQKDLDHWHYDMMAQTMLIRDNEGNYTPAHRSLLEFFVAYKFAAELGAIATDFIKLVQQHAHLNTPEDSRKETWYSYFQQTREYSKQAILSQFEQEPLKILKSTFGRLPLTKAVIDLLIPMIIPYSISIRHPLLQVIEATRKQSETEVNYTGGNAATLLVNLNRVSLEEKDLSYTTIINADFSSASLHKVNFTEANLKNSNFTKSLGTVLSVCFSPNGDLLATADTNSEIHIWRIENGEKISTYKGHLDWVRSVAFSKDGKILISGSNDQTLKLWDIRSGECLHTLKGHESWVRSVTSSSDGKTLASASADRSIRIWDITSKKCIAVLESHTDAVHEVVFNQSNTILASCSGFSDKTIRLWNTNTWQCFKTLRGHTDSVRTISFSHDGKILFSAGYDKTYRLWDVDAGNCIRVIKNDQIAINSIALNSDGRVLIGADSDGKIEIWDIETGRRLNILKGHKSWIRSVDFNAKYKLIASGGDDQTVRLWNFYTKKCIRTLQGYHHLILSVAFSPDNQCLASGSDDGLVRLWNLDTGKIFQSLSGHRKWVSTIAFNHDGTLLATGSSSDKTIKVWDLKSGQCIKTLRATGNWKIPIIFSPDSQTLINCDKNIINFWNVNSLASTKTLAEHDGEIKSLALSSDKQFLVSAGDDKVVKLWNLENYKCFMTLYGHTDRIWSVALSSDKQFLASCSGDKTVKIWNLRKGYCLKTLDEHTNQVRAVAFNKNNWLLASGSYDRTVKLWDIRSGKCIRTLIDHTNWVVSVCFSPDGKTLCSGSEDGTIKLWDVSNFSCIKTLIPDRPYEGMKITGIKGLTDIEKVNLTALGAVE